MLTGGPIASRHGGTTAAVPTSFGVRCWARPLVPNYEFKPRSMGLIRLPTMSRCAPVGSGKT
ncbi:Uncharacterised protein [Mycobacteroides abscessus subsp. abscessus]|nr:Uncharacterised protein [Mycobacteroides abscessus subsp. abscessus]